MSDYIPAAMVRRVRARAGDVCEYCRLPQFTQEATFHVDHIRPREAGGKTRLDNLALACVTCSLRKAARVRARDYPFRRFVRLFHPRRNLWIDHFRWTARWRVIGTTAVGRATVVALAMNRPRIVAIRRMLAALGLFPPPDPAAL
jgi:hypothetical protein